MGIEYGGQELLEGNFTVSWFGRWLLGKEAMQGSGLKEDLPMNISFLGKG